MLTAKWFLRSIISFLVLQGVLGDDEEEFPDCDYVRTVDTSTGAISGHVTSRNYKGNPVVSQCQYTIHIPQGHRLHLGINLDIEPSDSCSRASLQINDTLTVRTLCGRIQPYPIVVKEGVKYVHLSFREDKNQIRPNHVPNRFFVQYSTSPHHGGVGSAQHSS